jgi:hypothetical protein
MHSTSSNERDDDDDAVSGCCNGVAAILTIKKV